MYGYASLQTSRAERQLLDQQALALKAGQRSADSTGTFESARVTALSAFGDQGPRMARVLETLSTSLSEDMSLRSVTVRSSGTSWRVSISGAISSSNPERAELTLRQFVQLLEQSKLLGAAMSTAHVAGPSRTDEGFSDFAVEYVVPK
jgi:hypothetical protein